MGWCQGLDGLSERCAEYYKQGARFAKWRSVVNIAAGPSDKALFDCAYGLARYAAICQENGLVPIVEPEILLDGEHVIDTTLEIASKTWAQVFKCLADQDVMFEGILLKPCMVTPGADSGTKLAPEVIADYTLKMLNRRVPPAVPGIMFLSGGQSEMESTLNLNAMNQTPNPWHVSFSYARVGEGHVPGVGGLVHRVQVERGLHLGLPAREEEHDPDGGGHAAVEHLQGVVGDDLGGQLGARVRAGGHHGGLQEDALEHDVLVREALEDLGPGLGGDLEGGVDVVLAVEQDLGLDDGDKAVLLADGGVAGEAVGAVEEGLVGGARGDVHHGAPLGEAGALLVVLGAAPM